MLVCLCEESDHASQLDGSGETDVEAPSTPTFSTHSDVMRR